ncbi:hypothetical protein B296_00026872, partial [Ensete ventricosum]
EKIKAREAGRRLRPKAFSTIPPNAKIEHCFSGSSKTKPNTFRFPRGVLAPVLFDLRSPSPDASGSLMAIAPWPSSLSLLAGGRRSFPSFRPSQELRLPWSSNPYLVRRSPAHCCSGKIFRGGRALRSAEELCHELREFISATGLAENRVPSMKELCENGRPLVTPHFVYLLDDSSGEDCELYHDLASEVLIRKPMLWSTVLWLYPGVYEVRKVAKLAFHIFQSDSPLHRAVFVRSFIIVVGFSIILPV